MLLQSSVKFSPSGSERASQCTPEEDAPEYTSKSGRMEWLIRWVSVGLGGACGSGRAREPYKPNERLGTAARKAGRCRATEIVGASDKRRNAWGSRNQHLSGMPSFVATNVVADLFPTGDGPAAAAGRMQYTERLLQLAESVRNVQQARIDDVATTLRHLAWRRQACTEPVATLGVTEV